MEHPKQQTLLGSLLLVLFQAAKKFAEYSKESDTREEELNQQLERVDAERSKQDARESELKQKLLSAELELAALNSSVHAKPSITLVDMAVQVEVQDEGYHYERGQLDPSTARNDLEAVGTNINLKGTLRKEHDEKQDNIKETKSDDAGGIVQGGIAVEDLRIQEHGNKDRRHEEVLGCDSAPDVSLNVTTSIGECRETDCKAEEKVQIAANNFSTCELDNRVVNISWCELEDRVVNVSKCELEDRVVNPKHEHIGPYERPCESCPVACEAQTVPGQCCSTIEKKNVSDTQIRIKTKDIQVEANDLQVHGALDGISNVGQVEIASEETEGCNMQTDANPGRKVSDHVGQQLEEPSATAEKCQLNLTTVEETAPLKTVGAVFPDLSSFPNSRVISAGFVTSGAPSLDIVPGVHPVVGISCDSVSVGQRKEYHSSSGVSIVSVLDVTSLASEKEIQTGNACQERGSEAPTDAVTPGEVTVDRPEGNVDAASHALPNRDTEDSHPQHSINAPAQSMGSLKGDRKSTVGLSRGQDLVVSSPAKGNAELQISDASGEPSVRKGRMFMFNNQSDDGGSDFDVNDADLQESMYRKLSFGLHHNLAAPCAESEHTAQTAQCSPRHKPKPEVMSNSKEAVTADLDTGRQRATKDVLDSNLSQAGDWPETNGKNKDKKDLSSNRSNHDLQSVNPLTCQLGCPAPLTNTTEEGSDTSPGAFPDISNAPQHTHFPGASSPKHVEEAEESVNGVNVTIPAAPALEGANKKQADLPVACVIHQQQQQQQLTTTFQPMGEEFLTNSEAGEGRNEEKGFLTEERCSAQLELSVPRMHSNELPCSIKRVASAPVCLGFDDADHPCKRRCIGNLESNKLFEHQQEHEPDEGHQSLEQQQKEGWNAHKQEGVADHKHVHDPLLMKQSPTSNTRDTMPTRGAWGAAGEGVMGAAIRRDHDSEVFVAGERLHQAEAQVQGSDPEVEDSDSQVHHLENTEGIKAPSDDGTARESELRHEMDEEERPSGCNSEQTMCASTRCNKVLMEASDVTEGQLLSKDHSTENTLSDRSGKGEEIEKVGSKGKSQEGEDLLAQPDIDDQRGGTTQNDTTTTLTRSIQNNNVHVHEGTAEDSSKIFLTGGKSNHEAILLGNNCGNEIIIEGGKATVIAPTYGPLGTEEDGHAGDLNNQVQAEKESATFRMPEYTQVKKGNNDDHAKDKNSCEEQGGVLTTVNTSSGFRKPGGKEKSSSSSAYSEGRELPVVNEDGIPDVRMLPSVEMGPLSTDQGITVLPTKSRAAVPSTESIGISISTVAVPSTESMGISTPLSLNLGADTARVFFTDADNAPPSSRLQEPTAQSSKSAAQCALQISSHAEITGGNDSKSRSVTTTCAGLPHTTYLNGMSFHSDQAAVVLQPQGRLIPPKPVLDADNRIQSSSMDVSRHGIDSARTLNFSDHPAGPLRQGPVCLLPVSCVNPTSQITALGSRAAFQHSEPATPIAGYRLQEESETQMRRISYLSGGARQSTRPLLRFRIVRNTGNKDTATPGCVGHLPEGKLDMTDHLLSAGQSCSNPSLASDLISVQASGDDKDDQMRQRAWVTPLARELQRKEDTLKRAPYGLAHEVPPKSKRRMGAPLHQVAVLPAAPPQMAITQHPVVSKDNAAGCTCGDPPYGYMVSLSVSVRTTQSFA
ncbi:hypothetical protein CBR_g38535 [Chara braunii]|uniref:Uncharacterized protein n=1 Tax=Chara braunii TaxID=69332 RepID=A0A388JP06_CHABU|nr:hypothetical protein CBR_g38535 [Chara braunii]|eukprot:GBG59511.1 hypothetical protein CBR_g38535 [Chara braunii]